MVVILHSFINSYLLSSRYKNARLIVYQPFILRPCNIAFSSISYDRIILSLLADAVAVAIAMLFKLISFHYQSINVCTNVGSATYYPQLPSTSLALAPANIVVVVVVVVRFV